MSDTQALLDANAAFYAAMQAGDAEAMSELWAEDAAVSCIHPGWPAIVGREAVLGSFRDIFQSVGRPRVDCHHPHALITSGEGRVLCIEAIEGAALAASNHFIRIRGAWRLVHHQASQISPMSMEPETGGSTALH